MSAHRFGTYAGEAWKDIDREANAFPTATRCECGHLRVTHNGATAKNSGGDDCRMCNCPLFQKAARAVNS